MMHLKDTFTYLTEIGCCKTCCLRFFKSRGDEYEDVDKTLERLHVAETSESNRNDSQLAAKRLKSNVCVACLGFFGDEFLDSLTTQLTTHPDLAIYECNNYVLAICFPILLSLRQLSIWMALLEKFGPTAGCTIDKQPDVPLKEVSKIVIQPKVSKILGKHYGQNGVMINIFVSHPDEVTEVNALSKVDQILFKESNSTNKKSRDKKGTVNGMTRGYFEKVFQLAKIDKAIYMEHISVPPSIPSSPLVVESVTVTGPTIFVAGRYQKFSRELTHTPWVLNGKRVLEDSIQELIARSVAPHFDVRFEELKFSSSGREDVDVRCLGKGRPFVLEIPDAKRITLSQSEAQGLELEIQKTQVINVINLQIVSREQLVNIKSDEEDKRKTYRALCLLSKPATPEILEKLNIPNGFEIKQWTPLRVLHRRPLLQRPRKIYSLKARVDPNNKKKLVLDIVTQAGTYIKELVHGDFNRSDPCIAKILEQDVDIVALDVMAVDLNWPEDIDNRLR